MNFQRFNYATDKDCKYALLRSKRGKKEVTEKRDEILRG